MNKAFVEFRDVESAKDALTSLSNTQYHQDFPPLRIDYDRVRFFPTLFLTRYRTLANLRENVTLQTIQAFPAGLHLPTTDRHLFIRTPTNPITEMSLDQPKEVATILSFPLLLLPEDRPTDISLLPRGIHLTIDTSPSEIIGLPLETDTPITTATLLTTYQGVLMEMMPTTRGRRRRRR
jgi:hypothetical protein